MYNELSHISLLKYADNLDAIKYILAVYTLKTVSVTHILVTSIAFLLCT